MSKGKRNNAATRSPSLGRRAKATLRTLRKWADVGLDYLEDAGDEQAVRLLTAALDRQTKAVNDLAAHHAKQAAALKALLSSAADMESRLASLSECIDIDADDLLAEAAKAIDAAAKV